MALVAFDGAELGTPANIRLTTGFGGSISCVTTPVRNSYSTYAYKFDCAGAAAWQIVPDMTRDSAVTILGSTGFIAGWLYVSTLPGADIGLMEVQNNIFAVVGSLRITSGGRLRVYNASGVALGSNSTTALSTSTWYRLSWKFVSGGVWEVLIYDASGALLESISGGSFSSVTNFAVCLGNRNSVNGATSLFYWDDVIVDNAAHPADGNITFRTAGANGTYTQWNNDVASVDERVHNSGTDIITNFNANQKESYTLQSCLAAGIPANAIIVAFSATAVGTITLSRHWWPFIKSSVAEVNLGGSAQWTNAFYGSTYHLRTTDPATSVAWTISGLDAVEIGVVTQSAAASGGSTVTQIGGQVLYTIPVSGVGLSNRNFFLFFG